MLALPPPVPPPAGAPFDYQLGGAYRPAADVQVVVRDRTAAPLRGAYSVCYVNAFQVQPGATAWWRAHHPSLLLRRRGRLLLDEDWREPLLDTSTPARRSALAAVVGRWIDGCRTRGFDAVEPDNLDSFLRSRGALTVSDNRAFARLLIRRAHASGLAIAQKNTAELAAVGPRLGFDFAIVEECQRYRECGVYTRAYGRRVLEVEYSDAGGVAGFRAACRARGDRISIVLRDRDVLPAGRSGHVSMRCSRVEG